MNTAWATRVAMAIFIVAAPYTYGQTPTDRLPEILERAKISVGAQCARYRATLADGNARPFALEEARDGVEVICICFPQELDNTARTSQEHNGTAEQRAEAMGRAALETCVLRRTRIRLPEACRTDVKKIPDPKAREAHCQCLESRLAGLKDQDLIAGLLRARESYEARVAAVQKGDPAPPLAFGAFDDIEKACALEGQRLTPP